jgi:hypothetical protein
VRADAVEHRRLVALAQRHGRAFDPERAVARHERDRRLDLDLRPAEAHAVQAPDRVVELGLGQPDELLVVDQRHERAQHVPGCGVEGHRDRPVGRQVRRVDDVEAVELAGQHRQVQVARELAQQRPRG